MHEFQRVTVQNSILWRVSMLQYDTNELNL